MWKKWTSEIPLLQRFRKTIPFWFISSCGCWYESYDCLQSAPLVSVPLVLILAQTCHSASPIGLQANRHPLRSCIFVGDFRPVWMILFRYVYSNPDVELIPVLQTLICHTYVVSFNIDRSIDYIEVELFDSISFIPLHRIWNIQSEITFHFQFRWKRKLLCLVSAV